MSVSLAIDSCAVVAVSTRHQVSRIAPAAWTELRTLYAKGYAYPKDLLVRRLAINHATVSTFDSSSCDYHNPSILMVAVKESVNLAATATAQAMVGELAASAAAQVGAGVLALAQVGSCQVHSNLHQRCLLFQYVQ